MSEERKTRSGDDEKRVIETWIYECDITLSEGGREREVGRVYVGVSDKM